MKEDGSGEEGSGVRLSGLAARPRTERVNTSIQTRQHDHNKMSRQSMAPTRELSTTEQLEKLEQSITLTLQGEYHNDYPTMATEHSRNRPQLQPRTPHCYYRNTSNRRTVRKAFRGRLGGVQILEAVLRGQRQRLAVWL